MAVLAMTDYPPPQAHLFLAVFGAGMLAVLGVYLWWQMRRGGAK